MSASSTIGHAPILPGTDSAETAMLITLVELAGEATKATAAELVIIGEPDMLFATDGPSIGRSMAWTQRTHTTLDTRLDTAEGTAVEDWVGSIVAVPVTGPSAESGWIVVAHHDAEAFSAATETTLANIAMLVEERLDRTLEQSRLDQLSAVLQSNQEELHAARDRLAVSNTELEQFAYIAAHELVAPLRAVAVYAQVLERLVDKAGAAEEQPLGIVNQARECSTEIRSGVSLMNQQVQYLLELSRTQTNAASTELVDLGQVAQAALDTLAEPLHEVDAVVDVGAMPVVDGRAVPLQSVFANLISNAIRYRDTDRQLHIVLESTASAEGCRVTVRDNGVGVNATDQGRVFQLFERASTTAAGSGIGLALSRRIVEAFGGEIGIEADHEVGSVFWITFPPAAQP